MSTKENTNKTAEEFMKGCEHDGSYVPVKEVLRLMNEYSSLREQQEAIAFAEWVDESGYVDSSDYDPEDNAPKMWQLLNPNPPPYHGTLDCETENWDAMIGERLTTAQLYEFFKNEPKYKI